MAVVHYIREWFPGIFVSESCTREVKSRDPDAAIKNLNGRCYAFEFFDQEEIQKDGKKLIGPEENKSPTYFPGGREMSLRDLKREMPTQKILISNMECNKIKKIIRHRHGGFVEHKNPVIC